MNSSLWRLTALTLAVIICGCATSTSAAEVFPIDLPSALRLASAQNYKIAVAQEKIDQANARYSQAKVLLLPTLAVGASYNQHDGVLQETNGNVIEADRHSSYIGLGAGTVGAGSPQVPGLSVSTDLGDAIFEPLAAKQHARAAKAGSDAVSNQVLLEVTVAYYELLRTKAALAIAKEAHKNASDLAKLTRNFASVGEGLDSDAERAAVEKLVRQGELEAARENLQLRSAILAELLRLDTQVQLDPIDSNVLPINVVSSEDSLKSLIQTALGAHPELERREALAKAAMQRMRQEKYGPLFPTISMNYSAGDFEGETDLPLGFPEAQGKSSGDRTDFNVMVFWQLDNLGLGNRARFREQRSAYRQADLQGLAARDRVASEVTQAYVQVKAREKQIALGAAAVQRSSRSLDLNLTRIYERQGLPIEVLQAIQSLATTRKLYLDAVIDHNQAQFRLYTALGQPPAKAIAHAETSALETAVLPAK